MNEEKTAELIKRATDGDTDAFGQIVSLFQPLVYRLAFRLMCDEDEARDMVQETFIKAWSSLNRYDPRYKFQTWLYRIAANTCYDRMRSIKRSARTDMKENTGVISMEDIETSIDNRKLKEIITGLTDDLSPKQKLVFTLSDLEDMEPEEIETVTGLSPAKIKSNLYLARKYIRERINLIK